jgi:hypothetical protein
VKTLGRQEQSEAFALKFTDVLENLSCDASSDSRLLILGFRCVQPLASANRSLAKVCYPDPGVNCVYILYPTGILLARAQGLHVRVRGTTSASPPRLR